MEPIFFSKEKIAKILQDLGNSEMITGGQVLNGEEVVNFFLDMLSISPNPRKWRLVWEAPESMMRIFSDVRNSTPSYLLTLKYSADVRGLSMTNHLAKNIGSFPLMDSTTNTSTIVSRGNCYSLVLASRASSCLNSLISRPGGFLVEEMVGSTCTLYCAFQFCLSKDEEEEIEEIVDSMILFRDDIIGLVDKSVGENIATSTTSLPSKPVIFDLHPTYSMVKLKEERQFVQRVSPLMNYLPDKGANLVDRMQKFEIQNALHNFILSEEKATNELLSKLENVTLDSDSTDSSSSVNHPYIAVEHEDQMEEEGAAYVYSSTLEDDRKTRIRDKAAYLMGEAFEIFYPA